MDEEKLDDCSKPDPRLVLFASRMPIEFDDSFFERTKNIRFPIYCNQRSKNQQKQRIKTLTNNAAQTSAYQEIPTTDFLRPIPTIF